MDSQPDQPTTQTPHETISTLCSTCTETHQRTGVFLHMLRINKPLGLKTGPGSGSWLNKRLVVAGLLVKSGDDWALTSSGDDFGHWVEDVKDGVVRRWIVWCPEIIDSVVADSGRVVRVSESVLKSSSLSVDVAGLVAENAELRARVDRLTDALLKLTVPA